jgi:hypothetical protein
MLFFYSSSWLKKPATSLAECIARTMWPSATHERKADVGTG